MNLTAPPVPTPPESALRREQRGSLLVLTLSRPEVRNALSTPLIGELRAALEVARADPAVRGVVLTGDGAAFCGGLDVEELRAMAERRPEEHRADADAFRTLLETLYLFPKPTFAAVNGHAVAAGAGLVCACDFAVMEGRAKIGFTEAKIGFVAALVAVFLTRQIAEKHARDLLLSARLIGGEEAARIGLVTEVCPEGQALSRALALAQSVIANAPLSLAVTKAMLARAPHLSVEDGLREAAALNARARASASLREGVSAFLEKRSPDWDGLPTDLAEHEGVK
ncbi:methylglutaconyl-CoA hydratase [Deinococcus reticulitermitis]|uniref:Methylglutaconyl-CoA hydratase n=1 Tax=Deinococcus reticulitermitis TaxID=856736 RepID=A0A1H6Z7S1_9DEIO|nr:enoyl-CoA hydratase/isomerase family protein [Deinococcus reticulitermitis]SEJ49519.1 methylglutaconyl-CoA hydratase [Deinococcus reticulitermitis]